jgi:hypothetical protein
MAYEFASGTGQQLSSSAPLTNGPLTMACWFRPADAVGFQMIRLENTGTASSIILSCNSNTSPQRRVQAVTFDDAGNLSDVARFSNIIQTNSWQHACGVFDANSKPIAAYWNGSVGVVDTVGTATPTGINALYLGNSRTATPNVTRRIAEVGIWNAALTAAEIASLAKGMTCDKVRPQSLVFYAPLVRDLVDAKGGLTITNNNGATVAAHTRVYA